MKFNISDLTKASKTNQMKSRKWFIEKLREGRKQRPGPLRIGNMYCFVYDAKWKDRLPYWDTLPLSVIVKMYPDGFLGLNMHYLSVPDRIQLFILLQKMGVSSKNEIRISYMKLLGLSNTIWKHTLHRYLITHVKTPPVKILINDWPKTLALPVNTFVGASTKHVWSLA